MHEQLELAAQLLGPVFIGRKAPSTTATWFVSGSTSRMFSISPGKSILKATTVSLAVRAASCTCRWSADSNRIRACGKNVAAVAGQAAGRGHRW